MVSFRHPLRFNLWLLAMVGLICVVPSLLNLAGVDFGLKADGFSPLGNVRGLLLHTILLWSATCMAFFTFALAFFHYYVRRDFVTPVIGISILWGGFIDLFQTLAVDRFIQNTADSSLLIPFTWAIGRSFGIFILLLGVMILMVRKYRGNERGNARFFFLLAIAFGLAAFAIMDFLANSSNLPQIVFPDLLISRPWDVIPLFIYALAGLWVFRKFHAARRDSFSFAVWISVIPDIVAQLHMAFGSTELFDNSYNLAHIFKVISYMVPALGLLKDYVDIHHRLDMEVSERERSERDRRMLVALVDNTSEMIGLVGSQGEMSYCNRALVENLGIPLSEREGLPFSKIVNRATGSSLLRNLFDRAVQNGHAFGELELVTRDGSRLLPVQFSLFPVASNAFGASIFGIVMHDVTAQREQGEGRERHEQGLRRLISQRTAELALVNDKMRSELEGRKQLEAKLVEAQKMEAMGQLSAGIAHEINNPIGFVNVNLEMLTRYIQVYDKVLDGYGVLDQEPGKVDSVVNEVRQAKEELRYDQIRNDVGDLIAESRKGLARVIEIVRSLRSFSHPDNSSWQELSVSEVLDEALNIVWGQVKRFEVNKEYVEAPAIFGSRIQLSQVFINLLLNAAQAMEGEGVISLKIMNKGTHVLVVVSDTGHGIPKEHYSRLFDPFFTTKAVGQGTGLGLYISYGIIQKHRGDLLFHSEVGRGTSFQVILPVQQ